MKAGNRKYKTGICLLFAFFFFLPACEKEKPDCFEPNLVLTRVAFIAKDSLHVDSVIDSVYVDTTIVRYRDTFFKSPALISIDMPKNVMVYGNQYNNYIGAPLNPDSGSIRYALLYDTTSTLSDTLTYFYHSSIHFISNTCGFTHFFHIDSIHATRHQIDSVQLAIRDVSDKAADRHIKLYFFNQ